MSTKIYDAYRIKSTSLNDFNRFIKFLSNECKLINMQKLYKLIAIKAENIIDETIIARQSSNDTKDIDSLVCKLNDEMNTSLASMIRNFTRPNTKKLTADDIKANMAKYPSTYSPLWISKEIITNKIEFASSEHTVDHHAYNVQESICLFTLPDKDYVLFMAFGHTLQQLLYNMTNGDEKYKNIVDEFELKDWHYQNQTDQPDDITDDEWEQRETDWDNAFDTSIPAIDGTHIDITNTTMFVNDLFYIKSDNILPFIKSKEERVKMHAKAATVAENLEKHEPDERIYKVSTYERLIKNKDPEIMKQMDNYIKFYETILIDITAKTLTNGLQVSDSQLSS